MSTLPPIISELCRLTSHRSVRLVPSGDAAIFAALVCANKRRVLIPDQGGWLSYPRFPKLLGMECAEITTDAGLIDLADLQAKAAADSVFLYSNPGGYIAHQPAREIYGRCRRAGCSVLMDVSGSIGTAHADGASADLLVCSFGKWKAVNAGYGGFVSAREKQSLAHADWLFRMLKGPEESIAALREKVAAVPARLERLASARQQVLADLQHFDIVHRERWGLNVAVRYGNEGEKEKLIAYCTSKGLEWTLCPRLIRVNERAISIEIKRIS